jgi:mono/diheme cytochrome c family protein
MSSYLPRLAGAGAFGVIVALAFPAAVRAADADNGERLAKRWCAACHIVSSDQKSGSADVPSFASIAKRPDFAADKLASFLRDPHPKMPNMSLTRGEAADLAAYIGTQNK